MQLPKPHPDGIQLTALEISELVNFIDGEIIRLRKKRLWLQTIGTKSAHELTLDMWTRMRDKLH